ncbi:Predicted endonuclease distantly related to archaeal Holliday junction resolvase [hydrothermal vent metagenome]|uniref:Predicted endonuclease distantly related to archaeal Holliday junction resolvase n=1 Tax=hydrothermal vent metagenome TaxID=652676 RepID=A0A3B0WGE3_9ZZZZ
MWFKKKPPTAKNKGQQKEQQACDWLQAQGFHILEQNYLCKGGEIDIIALSSHTLSQATLVFFEVKYRKNDHFGHPIEFVTQKKQHRIIQCAQLFLLKNPTYAHCPMRFDVMTFEGAQTTPQWIENAFGM